VTDELDTEAINRKLTDALQKILQCGDARRGTRDSRLATIRHIARTTLDTLSKEKGRRRTRGLGAWIGNDQAVGHVASVAFLAASYFGSISSSLACSATDRGNLKLLAAYSISTTC
jgi:hypothetical protein